MTSDIEYMQLAIRLANKGLYTTEPNPRVGCVIVKGEDIVGQGWHERAGEAHAETRQHRSSPRRDLMRGGTLHRHAQHIGLELHQKSVLRRAAVDAEFGEPLA